ncbi:MAG: hypothetical protein AUK47_24370 [Deltaproteobacteria bacterium CG2_30_63_29]|nr:MAG: hypothetical protein AUK47_24370 [Deltaproteobacteria bacterium CG2_30_63_29]PJB35805.1 MAG: hypothetical protein CO108_24800 [Deltaproteobacteria bacterium CG_4_9_14_3_um_filter_63_12]
MKNFCSLRTGLLLVLVPLSFVPLPGEASAELRQHVLSQQRLDPEVVVNELVARMRDLGFTASKTREEKLTAPTQAQTLVIKLIEYSFYHPTDGRSASATFFVLDEPEPDSLADMMQYISTNWGYSASYGGAVLKDVGFMGWYEYDPMGVSAILENDLADWRQSYVDYE